MSGKAVIFAFYQNARNLSSTRRSFGVARVIYNRSTSPSVGVKSSVSHQETIPSNVPGLSNNVVNVSSEPQGPGASKTSDYKNPEYFCYHNMSYFEAEIEMLKHRCPQPTNKLPYTPNN